MSTHISASALLGATKPLIGSVQPSVDYPESQKELQDIMNMVKRKEITVDQAENLFSDWQKRHNSKHLSFNERRVSCQNPDLL